MKKLLLAGALFLAGCTQSGQVTVTAETVVQAIRDHCGVVTNLADVAALMSANTTAITVSTLAKKVCDAIQTQPAPHQGPQASQDRVVIVDNVPIRYRHQ